MKKLLFTILSAFMVSTMASAQYLNVKLDDGTYHSYKTSSKTEVSFGDKAGAEIMEPVQMIKLYKGDKVVAKYRAPQVDRVVYEEAPPTTGTANAAINNVETHVKWVQLWEDGPKFAEYNVGAENNKPEDYGGYYTWGGTYKNGIGITWNDDHNTGSVDLKGEYDTATYLWGDNWRMPTKEELEALINNENCTCTWIENYEGKDVNGLLCTGKAGTAFASNSVFLPAAGYFPIDTDVRGMGGYYWSSTHYADNYNAYYMHFNLNSHAMSGNTCTHGYSVRAVLNENE